MEKQLTPREKDNVITASQLLVAFGHLLNFSALEKEARVPRGTFSYIYKGARKMNSDQALYLMHALSAFSKTVYEAHLAYCIRAGSSQQY